MIDNTIIRAGDRVRVEAFEFDVTYVDRNSRYVLGVVAGGTVKLRASQVTKVVPPVPPVKVGDVIYTGEALAALPGGTILMNQFGLAVRRSLRNASVYIDGTAGEVPSYDVTLPLTVLFVPEVTR